MSHHLQDDALANYQHDAGKLAAHRVHVITHQQIDQLLAGKEQGDADCEFEQERQLDQEEQCSPDLLSRLIARHDSIAKYHCWDGESEEALISDVQHHQDEVGYVVPVRQH